MSFTPYGADGPRSGITDCRFPPFPACCSNRDRRCASMPFFYQVQDPPWFLCPPRTPRVKNPLIRRREYDYQLTYDNWQVYLDPSLEDRVMPAMAFWFYCDQFPDQPRAKRCLEYIPQKKKSFRTYPILNGSRSVCFT